MKLKYIIPDSEWQEAGYLLALAASETNATSEDFTGGFDYVEW